MSTPYVNISFPPAKSSMTLTVKICSGTPTGASSTRLIATPQFAELVNINGVAYPPGSPLVTSTGGTVYSTNPLVVDGATTSTADIIWINGTYAQNTKTAAAVISAEAIPARSQCNYGLWFINSTGATINDGLIATGMIYKNSTTVRVPVQNTGLKTCGVTVS